MTVYILNYCSLKLGLFFAGGLPRERPDAQLSRVVHRSTVSQESSAHQAGTISMSRI